MAAQDMASLLDRLGEAATECRAMIREMHEAEQSLKDAIKEARAAKIALMAAVTQDFKTMYHELAAAQVHAGLEEYKETIQTAIDNTSKKILSEFDKLSAPLLLAMGEAATVLNLRRAMRGEESID